MALVPLFQADAREKKLRDALRFIAELAQEAYGDVKQGTGEEIALRHIMRRAREALEGK
jgi:hypothetical protein